jgi:hypothetical protein
MKREVKKTIKCHICGDKGKVPRYYYEPYVGAIEGKILVPCKKCRGFVVKKVGARS